VPPRMRKRLRMRGLRVSPYRKKPGLGASSASETVKHGEHVHSDFTGDNWVYNVRSSGP
jgi:hypothetical protein